MAKSRRRRGLLAGKGQSAFGLPVDLPTPEGDATPPAEEDATEPAPVVEESLAASAPAADDPVEEAAASAEASSEPPAEPSEATEPTAEDASAAEAPAAAQPDASDSAVVSPPTPAISEETAATLDPVEPIPDDSPAHSFFAQSGTDEDFDPVVEDAPTVPVDAPNDGARDEDHIAGTEVREEAARSGSGYYVGTGEMPADTSELGWTSDVFGRDTGAPAGTRTRFPSPSTPTDEGKSIAAELFSDPESDLSGELSDPPTEEVPATLARHVGGTARDTASMDLPEPPPLPGILDRFTPAPMGERSELTNRLRRKTAFEPVAPSPTGRQAKEAGSADLRPPPAAVPAEEGGAGTWWLAAGVGALAAVLLILGVQFVLRGMSAPPPPPPTEAPARAHTSGVPTGAITAPSKAPEAPAVPSLMEPEEAEGDEAEPEAEAVGEAPQASKPAAPTPPPTPEPEEEGRARVMLSTPAALSPSTQKPATSEEPASVWGSAPDEGGSDAATGTLRIRTNVRALVQVDGGPQQYASRPLELSVGSHDITAFRPGRMDTAITKTVEVKAGETVTVQFSF